MADAYHHSLSSAKRWGGVPSLYREIHEWFDETKGWMPDARHRALRHHSEGIAQAVKLFGPTIPVGDRLIPVRWIAEQHVREDLGKIPTAADWLRCMAIDDWMVSRAEPLSKVLA